MATRRLTVDQPPSVTRPRALRPTTFSPAAGSDIAHDLAGLPCHDCGHPDWRRFSLGRRPDKTGYATITAAPVPWSRAYEREKVSDTFLEVMGSERTDGGGGHGGFGDSEIGAVGGGEGDLVAGPERPV